MLDKIIIKGAREHNLKNIDLEIQKNKLVVFTGISGSGKSSLAFDTIYAEGQRRYVESLSAYARQFLGLMDKPDCDKIEGLSPAISIDQKSTSHNPRSTVGTVTEIYDYLRLLFARVGHPHCPKCGREIAHKTVDTIVNEIQSFGKPRRKPETRVLILSPVVKDRKGEFSQLFSDLRKRGYAKVRVDRQVKSLQDDFILIKTNKHTIDVVIDKLVLPASDRSRLTQSVEEALRLADGSLIVSLIKDKAFSIPEFPKVLEDHLFSERFACPVDNIALPEIEPRTFSFNSPHGACPTCSGLGSTLTPDPELMLNPRLSISEGGILPFARTFLVDTWFARTVRKVCEVNGISLTAAIGELIARDKDVLLRGTGDAVYEVSGENRFGRMTTIYETFPGLISELVRRHSETDSDFLRGELGKYMRYEVCKTCDGSRLKPSSLSITLDNKSIASVSQLSIRGAFAWLESLQTGKLSEREAIIARPILKELLSRLRFLIDVGLEYLTIERGSNTLAGGEAQRIRLASQIGSGLTGILYVLDEPTIGLHERDNHRLIETLKKLRDIGNSVIVVEHDRTMMENADWLIDFGPGAGRHGGYIVFEGTPKELAKDKKSLTGKYFSRQKKIVIYSQNESPPTSRSGYQNQRADNKMLLSIHKASEHNLKKIDVSFPLGKFIAVTGVSGSGKSTLVHDVLYKALRSHFSYRMLERAGKHEKITGVEYVDKVILIDQSPIGRTPRSNPATYTGVFTYIRELFARTQDARMRGYRTGRFSFNVKGGRCEGCEGEGQIKIEMQFLSDVYITCDVCGGSRYNSEVLEVRYREKNIAEVLSLSVDEGLRFFEHNGLIENKLRTLSQVGLSYMQLGQPAPTLSGGEAQRVKLATELSKRPTGHTLYLLDEPTTGLHFADIEKLLMILRKLVDLGNTVIIIEHNVDVIKNADWIIDLGPEGGDEGGQVIAKGTPWEVTKMKSSYTGQFLRKVLA